MYFLYADESGDTGLLPGSTDHFVLSALILHELSWHETLERIIDFRRQLRAHYGLKLREEIHARAFIHGGKGCPVRIPKHKRLLILRDVLVFEATLPDVSLINVVVDKIGKGQTYDVFSNAWQALIQRFHNTLSYKNFPGPQNPQDKGLLVVDQTDEKKLRELTRRMRRYNPVPSSIQPGTSRQILLTTVNEDPIHRNSLHSYFVQLCDVNAYFLKQRELACGYVKKKGAKNFFSRLGPILCRHASRFDPHGIVRL